MSLVSQLQSVIGRIASEFNAIRPKLVPAGGALGSVLRKTSVDDHELEWATLGTMAYEPKTSYALVSHTQGWGTITGKPTTFTPSTHTHATAQVTGLDAALAGKMPLDILVINDWLAVTTPGRYFSWAGNAGGVSNLPGDTQVGVWVGDVTVTGSRVTVRVWRADTGFSYDDPGGAGTWVNQKNGTTWSGWEQCIETVRQADYRYARLSHSHAWGEITGKPTEFTPASHVHGIGDVTGLQTALDAKADQSAFSVVESKVAGISSGADVTAQALTGFSNKTDLQVQDKFAVVDNATNVSKLMMWGFLRAQVKSYTDGYYAPTSHAHAWNDITGKPTTFTPSAHSHGIGDVTGLQTALDGKSDTDHTHSGLVTSFDGGGFSSNFFPIDKVYGPRTFTAAGESLVAFSILEVDATGGGTGEISMRMRLVNPADDSVLWNGPVEYAYVDGSKSVVQMRNFFWDDVTPGVSYRTEIVAKGQMNLAILNAYTKILCF